MPGGGKRDAAELIPFAGPMAMAASATIRATAKRAWRKTLDIMRPKER